MMKIKSLFELTTINILVSLLLLSSCQSDSKQIEDSYPYFKISDDFISLYGCEGDTTIVFCSDHEWYIGDLEESWISVSPMKGKAGNNKLKIHVDKNRTGSSRFTRLNFNAINPYKEGSIYQDVYFYEVNQMPAGSISLKKILLRIQFYCANKQVTTPFSIRIITVMTA